MDDSKVRVTIISLTILTLFLLGGLAVSDYKKKLVSEELTREKLKTESLLSEKLLLAKDISKKEKAEARLDQLVDRLMDSVAYQSSELAKATGAKARLQRDLRDTKSINDAVYSRAMTKFDSAVKASKNLAAQLQTSSDSIKLLTKRNSNLEAELAVARLTTFDNTLITGLKRNAKKITSRARRTNKLIASVLVPGDFQNLNFSVEGPDGNVVTLQSKDLTARVPGPQDIATASIEGNIYVPSLKPREVEIVYDPEEKLDPGVYTFRIFNKEQYVGSMHVKLR